MQNWGWGQTRGRLCSEQIGCLPHSEKTPRGKPERSKTSGKSYQEAVGYSNQEKPITR